MNHGAFNYFLISILTLFLTACSSEESTTLSHPVTGTFVDKPVSGLTYSCSSATDIYETDENGKFTCQVWDDVTFALNNTTTGVANATTDVITPYTLFPNDNLAAVNLATLLQSMDSSLDDEIISLDKNLLALLPSDLDFSSPTFTEDVEKALDLKLVDAQEAKKAMDESIKAHDGEVPRTPTISTLIASIDENSQHPKQIGTLTIIDEGETAITAMNLTGEGSHNFDINIKGEISVAIDALLDYETTPSFALHATATNSAGNSNTASIIISLNDINETEPSTGVPILEDFSASIAENSSPETVVGTISITSSGSTPISAILLSGDGSTNFTTSPDGLISVAVDAELDYETTSQFDLTAVAINSIGNSESIAVTISLIDVNETAPQPILANSVASVEENSEPGTLVGYVEIVSSGTSAITSITLAGEGNYTFNVSPTGTITTSIDSYLDYEAIPFYNFTAVATNSAGNSNSVDVNITIIDVNETTPIVATLENANLTVSENASSGTLIGSIPILDSGSDTITSFTLLGTGSSNFTVNALGEVRVASGSTLDYETLQYYLLSAYATSSAGNSDSVNVTIDILDYINPFLIAKVLSNDSNASDFLGYSVAVSGEYIVVGAPNANSSTTKSGSVYLFKKDAEGKVTQVAKILSSNPQASDGFGSSVAIDDPYIIVGAPGWDADAFNDAFDNGKIFIFKRNSLALNDVSEIDNIPNSSPYAKLGNSVSISGNYFLAGAPDDDTVASNAGNAYLYLIDTVNDTVSQIADMSFANPQADDSFGTSVSLSGDYFVVGSPRSDNPSANEGSVYTFKRNSDTNVTLLQKSSASITNADDQFGYSVSINNNYFVVGTLFSGTSGANGDDVYLFKIASDSSISEISNFTSSDFTTGDVFGSTVAMSGNYIVAGAHGDDTNTGSAYIFKRDSDLSSGVTEIKKILANKPAQDDVFANAVAIDQNIIAIGSKFYENDNRGALYVADIEAADKPYIYNPVSLINRNEVWQKGTIHHYEAASPVGGTITFTTSGIDGSHFTFSGADISFLSQVTPLAAADFEVPVDANTDNTYEIVVTAADDGGNATETNLNVTIKDKYAFEVANLIGFDSQQNDEFGSSIATDGNYTIIGAPGEDTDATDSGAAYLYKKQSDESMTYITKLKAPSSDINANDAFGSSVAISGDIIVIGAPVDDTNGSAYVYIRNDDSSTGTSLISKIQSSAPSGSDKFGTAVSISGNYLVVGAINTDSGGNTNAGVVDLFSTTTTSVIHEAQIISTNESADNNFGLSLSIDGKYILTGSNSGSTNKGEAILSFIDDVATVGVNNVATITASDGLDFDYFAHSVSIKNNYLVIGAPDNNSSGSAYIYEKDVNDNVTLLSKLHPTDVTLYSKFGSSVSTNGTTIAIGAPEDDFRATNAGSFYMYQIDAGAGTLFRLDKLTASDAGMDNNFGHAVSLSGDNLSVGIKFFDTFSSGATSSGRAYMFIKDPNQVIP